MEETTNATTAPSLETINTILLNDNAINRLKSIVKWSNILVTIIFVILGISIVFCLFSMQILEKVMYLYGQAMPPVPAASYILNVIFDLIFLGIGFIPYYFLYKFNKKAKAALIEKDENLIAEALASQSSYFKILTIYMIIALSLLAIFFVGMILILFMVA